MIAKDYILGQNGGQTTITAKGEPDFTQVADTNDGMFAAPDTYGTAYYYRGAVDNNWLLFNGIYWRIVSIAGDGSLKLLYSGTTAPTESQAVVMTGSETQIGANRFNSPTNNNAYVGYMFTENELHGLGTSSRIKTELESWYTNAMSSVDSQIEDNLFCYDRTLAKSGYHNLYFASANGSYLGNGLGQNPTLYGTAARITASNNILGPGGSGPELTCSNKTDAYTVDDDINGNGAISKKVGLLSADEAVMAGLVAGTANGTTNNYLYTNSSYWLGSPFGFGMNNDAQCWTVFSTGYLRNVQFNSLGIRPIIYLKSNIFLSGTGEWNNIYKIK